MTFEQCVQKAYSIMTSRAEYWLLQYGNTERGGAYLSAAEILREAMEGNWEALNQYDDYSDED